MDQETEQPTVEQPSQHEAIVPAKPLQFTEVGSFIVFGDPNDPEVKRAILEAQEVARG